MKKILPVLLLLLVYSCRSAKDPELVGRTMSVAEEQTRLMTDKLSDSHKLPNSMHDDTRELTFVGIKGWTSGFFPGTLWYLYDYTKDPQWESRARAWNAQLEPLRHFNEHHDVGFMVECSFGNGYRLTRDTAYRAILIDAAEALCTRFNPTVGLIKSWNRPEPDRYLVIIDNMMNLELLFDAHELSGNPKFREIAVTHADNTLKHHYRPDGSSYHVVDFHPQTGAVNKKHTAQGYADESAWARGQAWGLYGFTMCYRFTQDKKYLEQAEKIAAFLLGHKNLPEDYVFYWDFDAPDIPAAPRDVSATAIAASALLELSGYSGTHRKRYFEAAEKMLESLSRPPYLAPVGENHHFILTNSVGALPNNSQVSVPLSYADYYFVEALIRYDRYPGK